MNTPTEPEVSSSPAAGSPARRPPGWFGIKDLFTTINALGGVVAICLCIDGEPYWAGWAMLLGYTFGDTLDGWVARKLGTSNQFGAEYDTISDHLAHCIAPGAMVYTVYRDVDLGLVHWAQHVLAIALGGAIMVTASIRHARNIARPISYKGVWIGLPRTVLGFLPVAFVNASLTARVPGAYWFGVALISLTCVSALTYWPFPNHHLPRRHHWYVRVWIAASFGGLALVGLLARRYLFDGLFLVTFSYSVGSWVTLTSDERRTFRATVRKGLAEVSA